MELRKRNTFRLKELKVSSSEQNHFSNLIMFKSSFIDKDNLFYIWPSFLSLLLTKAASIELLPLEEHESWESPLPFLYWKTSI